MSRLSPSSLPVEDSVVARALDRACGARAIPGNKVAYLQDGPEAFAAMLDVIDNAQSTVSFENYIISDDATGRRFADHLMEAAGRGVHVQVLYDHLGCRRTSGSY